MLAGKRPIPKKYVTQFADDLGLDHQACLYLDALIDFHNARAPKEKDFCLGRMRAIAPHQPIAYLELEHFKFLGDPVHVWILEMMDLPGFVADPVWIQKQLRFPVDLARIDSAVDRLAVLGLIEETANGVFVKKQRHLTSRKDVTCQGIQEYHSNVSQLAAEAVRTQALEEREFNSYALNISRDMLPKAKERLRLFAMEFIKEVEAEPKAATDTFQLNLQLFGVSSVATARRTLDK